MQSNEEKQRKFWETGERIRRMRICQGLTAVQLAAVAGISFQRIRDVESGHITKAYSETLEKIAEALSLPYFYFTEPAPDVTGLEKWPDYIVAQEFEKRFIR